MESLREILKEIKEYYSLYAQTFKRIFLEGIDWRGYALEISAAFIAGLLYIRQNGWGVALGNLSDFLLYVLAIPGGIAFLYLVYKLIYTPIDILKKREDDFKNELYKKESEIEKHTWNNIDFYIESYSIIGMEGEAFKIHNLKDFDLEKVKVEITAIRKNQEIKKLPTKHWLGYIDTDRREIEEKIINSSKGVTIKSKDYIEFAVTVAKNTRTSKKLNFLTYPEESRELTFPFSIDYTSSMVASLNQSMLAMATMLGSVPLDPKVVIELRINAEVRIEDDEINTLPIKLINIEILPNGSLSFYEKEEQNDHKN